jgi:hypothetical protein
VVTLYAPSRAKPPHMFDKCRARVKYVLLSTMRCRWRWEIAEACATRASAVKRVHIWYVCTLSVVTGYLCFQNRLRETDAPTCPRLNRSSIPKLGIPLSALRETKDLRSRTNFSLYPTSYQCHARSKNNRAARETNAHAPQTPCIPDRSC